ncbi:CPBP family intramembrane glutamic endopeptidase [Streptococcus ferus]|uniref:CPBP family intramembrane glutamic endopeptidase n=2 Tax=Bacteria TaxID=2 RepID=UPI00359FC80D
MSLKFNHTFKENQQLNLGWKPVIFTYLAYALIMGLFMPVGIQVLKLGKLPTILLAYTISAIVCLSLILKFGRTPASMGLHKEGILQKWLAGWGVAFLSLGLVFLINYLLNGLNTAYNNQFLPFIFLLLLLGFTVQSFMEEFLLRALIQEQITMKFGVLMGILGNSLIFAIGHLNNPNASILSIFNTFLIAIVFSFMFYYHDNLWIVAGFHAGWNFILGPVLGITVSGFDLPTTLLKTSFHLDKAYLNGGKYGFEASYPVTIISLIMIAIYLILVTKKQQNDTL